MCNSPLTYWKMRGETHSTFSKTVIKLGKGEASIHEL